MEELREMTHYLGFMPTRLMLEDSRTAYFDRILLECGWGFKKDGVSICSGKKRSVFHSSCRGMWSKAPVKSTKVLNKRIGLSFKMHLLLTWILMYFRLPLPKLTEMICPWFLDQRLSTIILIYPMDKKSSSFMTTTCSSTAIAKLHDVHPSLAGSDRSGMSSSQSTRFGHAVKRNSQFREGWRVLGLDGQIRLNIFGFFAGEDFFLSLNLKKHKEK